jgi:hypothetical protein
MSDIASTGIMAFRYGGFEMARACCVPPGYEVPTVPIPPSDHPWPPIHTAVSYPSATSSRSGNHRSSER